MLTELALPALVLISVGLFWHSALGAREVARGHARRLCAEAQLQLLDETVSLQHMRPRRDRGGHWRWLRSYTFEVSSDRINRLQGSVRMLGEEIIGSSLPASGAGAPRDALINPKQAA